VSWVCSNEEAVEAAVINLSKVYEEGGVVGNEPGGVSMLKVNGIRLIMLGRAFWDTSRERSRSTSAEG
jgi:hypothetical protein